MYPEIAKLGKFSYLFYSNENDNVTDWIVQEESVLYPLEH